MPALLPPETCLPWWHDAMDAVPRTRLVSGCGKAGADGRVPCDPNAMRGGAERKLREMGIWTSRGSIPLAAYTLARHMASEHGSGSVESKMLLALSTIQRARMWYDGDPNKLLLYHRPMQAPGTYGSYGPIHGPDGISTAPYGRWASTSLDPTAQDVMVALLALSGEVDDFRHGADDQLGIKYFEDRDGYVRRKAASGVYWIGHVPGVNPMETFFVTALPQVPAASALGQALQQRAFALFADPRTQAWLRDEKRTDVPWNIARGTCRRRRRDWGTIALGAIAVAGLGGAAWMEYRRPGGVFARLLR